MSKESSTSGVDQGASDNSSTNQAQGGKTPIVAKEFLVTFIVITSLFALWGFANDITNPMVAAFKKVMPELTNMQSAFVQLAFYGGYATMAIPAALFIRKFSYKTGILIGLGLYATGALLFYPAAKYEMFAFFLASIYILTFGLAFLETTSNPFILYMGDKETATQRLNLAQAFNPMGSLFGMLVAQIAVISHLQSTDTYTTEKYGVPYDKLTDTVKASIKTHDLGVISTPYIFLGLFVIVMFIVILMLKVPEKKDHDSINLGETVKMLFKNPRYIGGVVAQTFYVGAQIMMWTFIFQYVDNLNHHLKLTGPDAIPGAKPIVATWWNMAAMISFLASRWISTLLMKYIRPVTLMFIFALGGILTTLGTVFIYGMGGLYCLVATSIFMSLMFPTIYGIALKDMGDEAKLASAGLILAIVGGALMPPLQASIMDLGGKGLDDVKFFGYVPEINLSFLLPTFCFIIIAIYSFFVWRHYKAKGIHS